MLKSYFKISLNILKVIRKRFYTAWFIWRMNQRNYVCSLANVIQFYWLSSEFNQRFNELRYKHDSAVRECIATFKSDDMNVCSSSEHSETSTFVV